MYLYSYVQSQYIISPRKFDLFHNFKTQLDEIFSSLKQFQKHKIYLILSIKYFLHVFLFAIWSLMKVDQLCFSTEIYILEGGKSAKERALLVAFVLLDSPLEDANA